MVNHRDHIAYTNLIHFNKQSMFNQKRLLTRTVFCYIYLRRFIELRENYYYRQKRHKYNIFEERGGRGRCKREKRTIGKGAWKDRKGGGRGNIREGKNRGSGGRTTSFQISPKTFCPYASIQADHTLSNFLGKIPAFIGYFIEEEGLY